jgi:hypothetical protein
VRRRTKAADNSNRSKEEGIGEDTTSDSDNAPAMPLATAQWVCGSQRFNGCEATTAAVGSLTGSTCKWCGASVVAEQDALEQDAPHWPPRIQHWPHALRKWRS